MGQAIREAAELLRAARRVLLTTHIQPDPDGLGSERALAECLAAGGTEVVCLNPEPIPPRFRFLDPDGAIAVHEPTRPVPEADLIVVLDTGAWSQLGGMEAVVRRRAGRCMVIDHHVTGDAMGDLALVDAAAPCAAALVLAVIDEVGHAPSMGAAAALFAALVHDTGWLRYSNADPSAFAMASRLVAAGVNAHEVYLALEERHPAAFIRLTGLTLAGLELAARGTLAIMTVTAGMLSVTGTTAAEVNNLVNHAYSVEGVHSALLLVEQPDGAVRASLRSRGVVDVSALATTYGGGGHARAAGARLVAPIDQVKRRLVADFVHAIERAGKA